MIHEEREALRGLCEDAWFIYVNGKTLDSIRLVALLDALDTKETINNLYATTLDMESAKLKDVISDRNRQKARAEAAEARAEALEAERDAAIADLKAYGKNVHTCVYSLVCQYVKTDHAACCDCTEWEWRGQEGGERDDR